MVLSSINLGTTHKSFYIRSSTCVQEAELFLEGRLKFNLGRMFW